ncbi:7-cyano-7-deazaguanine synthase [Candidatus Woesearchaeota archaeon]|nr:7-cyano-7-deazaguanine synthase [Candidatus Woesearchaeota archaeon]
MVKVLCLISSGIDSPVAMYKMLETGFEVVAIHFDNQPFTDQKPFEKTKKIVCFLAEKFHRKIKLYKINHGLNQAEFMRNCDNRHRCLLCRRFMFRIAEKIAAQESCKYLVTGENLGQVCSQTLQNMTNALKSVDIEILKPLLSYDKQDIINLAKKIGTFEFSIEAAVCCNAVPQNPVTKSREESIKFEESKIDVDKLIKSSIDRAESEIVG